MDIIDEKFCMSKNLYKKQKGNNVYIYNKYSKTGCYLNEKESFVLQKLDGHLTYGDLLSKGFFALSENGYGKLINKYKELNLLANYESKVKYSIFCYKIGLFNPNKWLDINIGLISKLMLYIMILSIPLILIGGFVTEYKLLIESIFKMINIKSGVVLYLSSFAFLAFHELSHAAIAKKHGAEVVEIGFMMYLFIPFIYVTIGGLQHITPKSKMLTAASGILSNVFFCGIILCTMRIIPAGYESLTLMSFLLCNVGQIIVNCNLFLQVDTYFIVESFLGIPMIYNRSHKFSIKENQENNMYNLLCIKIYGIFSIINTIVIMMFIAANIWTIMRYGGFS